MSIIVLHVVGATCESQGTDRKPVSGSFPRINLTVPRKIRMAAKPGNFANAGFSFSCRTPHDRNAPSWAARKETSLARNMAHCTALAYLTGGDDPAASRAGSRVKGVTGESLAGSLASSDSAATITGPCMDST